MRLHDTPTGYGWVSILLHWLTVVAIIGLLFIGNSIGVAGDRMLHLHTSIAISAYVLIAIRVWWRFHEGHPGPAPGQEGWTYTLGKIVHYIMVVAMAVMLISGPLQAWAGAMPVLVFDWFEIPSPFTHDPALFEITHLAHVSGAIVLAVGTLLHIGGVLKHTIWNRDHTLVKMIIPAKALEPAMPETRREEPSARTASE